MAHSHYVMDLYFLTDSSPDQFRREVLRIEGSSDDQAKAEGQRIGSWKRPAYFVIRAIQTATRGGGRTVFDSRDGAETADEGTSVIAVAP